MLQFINSYLDERGQTILEYVLVMGVTCALAYAAFADGTIYDSVSNLFVTIKSNLQTG